MSKFTWYKLVIPNFYQNIDMSCIKKASRYDIKKYDLNNYSITPRKISVCNKTHTNTIFTTDIHECFDAIIYWMIGYKNSAENRIQLAKELKMEFMKKEKEEYRIAREKIQAIKNSIGLGI